MRKVIGGVLSAGALFAAQLFTAPSASASTITYTADQCSSAERCFVIFYNSYGTNLPFESTCFITNNSEYSHTGRTAVTSGGLHELRYQFSYSRIWDDMGGSDQNSFGDACYGGSGQGQSVKNNAAGANNSDSRSHRIYYNTGYKGTYQTFSPDESDNLVASLKNDNASSRRL